MAQSKILLSFRARLRSRGYRNIKITRDLSSKGQRYDRFGQPTYVVNCTEPLFGYQLSFVASEIQMSNWPGIEFEHVLYFGQQTSLFEDDDDCIDGVYII